MKTSRKIELLSNISEIPDHYWNTATFRLSSVKSDKEQAKGIIAFDNLSGLTLHREIKTINIVNMK